jgi:tRNA-splicing ligase RtcB (3'-phosphate/5'-hydroxy nucleic acid ligase)
MKKLILKGEQIKQMGFREDKLIGIILNLAGKHFKRNEKDIVLGRLQLLLHSPDNYINDEVFGAVATQLINQRKPESKLAQFRNIDPGAYAIFGHELIDDEAIRQMNDAMSLPISISGALMADAHSGYGLPIGGVLAAYNSVIPYGVGMDIGCRMCLSIFDLPPEYLQNNKPFLKKILVENTRFDLAEFNDVQEHELLERKEFREIKFLASLKDKVRSQLGTSGGGNHFVDIGIVSIPDNASTELGIKPGNYLGILSHSGSRNFGANIAEHYTRLAYEKRGLSKGLKYLSWLNLDEEEGQEYWSAMTLAGDFASANHHIIHQKLAKALKTAPLKMIENHHNFAWKESMNDKEQLIVHRKGATPANKGQLGIIPGSMTSPGFVVCGKGNAKSLNSASHGAGRVMSRRKAMESFSAKEVKQFLNKCGVDLIGGGTDEAPMAYKNIEKVMLHQKDLVDILAVFQPKIVRMSGK